MRKKYFIYAFFLFWAGGAPIIARAGYYQPEWYSLLGEDSAQKNYTSSWVGLLNSPLVRQ